MRTKDRLGGVPTSVVSPPTVQPYAIPSIRPTDRWRAPSRPASLSICRQMARPIGTIMTAVAVFEIHIDRNAAATMKPRTIRAGPPPTAWMMLSAIRRCRFHFSIVRAIMKPPRKSTIVLLK